MSHNAINAVPRSGIRAAMRRWLGLHEHAFMPWTSYWVAPRDDGRMTVLQTRRCTQCEREEYRQEVVDVPPTGLPYELHLDPAARPRD